MSAASAYFLGSKKTIVLLETLEITHPQFSRAYRIVRNAVGGITAQVEGGTSRNFTYYPTRITKGARADDLNFSIQADFGELGEIVPQELDLIRANDAFGTKPTVTYRSFRSDDLTAPLDGPYVLEAEQFACDAFACSFVAAAPQLNLLGTGEIYTLARFEMLRGFL
jgi:hypothetical protein